MIFVFPFMFIDRKHVDLMMKVCVSLIFSDEIIKLEMKIMIRRLMRWKSFDIHSTNCAKLSQPILVLMLNDFLNWFQMTFDFPFLTSLDLHIDTHI